ncbi:MAG: hypothetical protein ABI960_00950 [Candidatus Eisenbacteria bacterium]
MKRTAALLALVLAGASMGSCHAARVFAPAPAVRVSSAALYALNVEFAQSLDRASAQDVAHFTIRSAGGGAVAAISSAALIDTLYGRVVQLVIPAWFGDSAADRADFVVQTRGLVDAYGRAIPDADTFVRTGLAYGEGMSALFDTHCTSCHGASAPAGSYRTDSLAGLRGSGLDATPNLIIGDPNSLVVRKCKPGNSMFTAGNLTDLDFESIRDWIVDYRARP